MTYIKMGCCVWNSEGEEANLIHNGVTLHLSEESETWGWIHSIRLRNTEVQIKSLCTVCATSGSLHTLLWCTSTFSYLFCSSWP